MVSPTPRIYHLLVIISLLAALGLIASWIGSLQASAATQAILYASPSGSGSICSFDSPCSLSGVRDKVRTMNGNMTGDIIVNLRGGTYTLASTFQLTAQDSGANGYNVIYKAYDGEIPVISGGTTITGWALFDKTKNIYRANAGKSLQTRQLYVNGVRATRARGVNNPAGFTKTAAGYITSDTNMQRWGNQSDIEVVSQVAWKCFRCGVSTISGTSIAMKQPCWSNSQLQADFAIGLPTWIENAYELLDEEGEWYLDRSTGYLYYKPRCGEDVATATIIAPTLETLISGTGTLDNPLHNIQLKGITFSYATWLAPNGNDGFSEVQANHTLTGQSPNFDDVSSFRQTPAAITFSTAKSVRLERNVFTRLGAVGLGIENGSQGDSVIGNLFYDISGTAIQIGGISVSDHHPSDSRMRMLNNTVSDNYIHDVAVEFQGGVGIFVGYTDGTTVSQNEIANLPYSAISVGWGWGWTDPGGHDGYTTPTTSQNNHIDNNLIHDYMRVLADGGAIYTLSSQPNSTISGNFAHHQSNSAGAIYLDEGTKNYNVYKNVLYAVPSWLYIWTNSIQRNTVQYNFSDTSNLVNNGTNITVGNNIIVPDRNWPEDAQQIMINAGLEAAYADIKNLPSAPAPTPIPVTSLSAASYKGPVIASEAIVAAFGAALATSLESATTVPLPTSLAGTTVKVKDSLGIERLAPLLFTSANQVNYQIPPGTALGTATVSIRSGCGYTSTGTIQIAAVTPGLFAANANGQGVAMGVILRVKADGTQSYEPVVQFDGAQNKFVSYPIDLGPATDQVFLVLFGTGLRYRSSLLAVTAAIGGVDAQVLYAGAQGQFAGLDQVNVRVPRSLIGQGEVDFRLVADGQAANTVRINIR